MMKKLSLIFLVLFLAGLAVYLLVNSPFRETAGKVYINRPSLNYSLVNINTAGEAELVTLPSIGEKTAKNIIEYRTKNGKFAGIEELKNVKGIGEKTFLKLKERISAE